MSVGGDEYQKGMRVRFERNRRLHGLWRGDDDDDNHIFLSQQEHVVPYATTLTYENIRAGHITRKHDDRGGTRMDTKRSKKQNRSPDC